MVCDKVVCERLSVTKLYEVVCEKVARDKVACDRDCL